MCGYEEVTLVNASDVVVKHVFSTEANMEPREGRPLYLLVTERDLFARFKSS